MHGVGCSPSELEEEEPCFGGECPPVCIVGGTEYALGDVISESLCEIW